MSNGFARGDCPTGAVTLVWAYRTGTIRLVRLAHGAGSAMLLVAAMGCAAEADLDGADDVVGVVPTVAEAPQPVSAASSNTTVPVTTLDMGVRYNLPGRRSCMALMLKETVPGPGWLHPADPRTRQ